LLTTIEVALKKPRRPEEYRETLNECRDSGQQISQLVERLLTLARIDAGVDRVRVEKVDVAALAEQCTALVRPLAEARGLTLRMHSEGEAVLRADPGKLREVLTNLLHNAIEYNRPAGSVDLRVTRHNGHLRVEVRDTGIGIAPEMLPHVFEMFTQADRSLDRSQGGLGIGLTLVRHLVAMHGGRVQASSDGLGEGSEFVVRLPVLSHVREVGGAREKPDAAFAAPPCRRILIADDNEDFAKLSGRLLERKGGHRVRVVYDGPAALEAARAFQPEVAFLDIGLPGINGYDLAQQLRTEPGLDEILLVALTGYGQEADRRRALEAGFDEHLTKPVRFDALQRVLAERAAAAAV
jgi:two-component system CheB/CheR fusion protein